MNSGIQLYSGEVFDPLDPEIDKIHIEDIAHSLALQCRFSGHINRFYSVAEHSVRVSRAILAAKYSEQESLCGLLHDASEAYLVDMPAPLKSDPVFGQRYRGVENRLMKVISERFNLSESHLIVKEYDVILLATEFRDLLGHYATPEEEALWWPWLAGIEPLKTKINPWTSAKAEKEFLLRYERLK